MAREEWQWAHLWHRRAFPTDAIIHLMRHRAAKVAVGLPAASFAYLSYLYLTVPDVRALATTNPPTTALIELRAAE